jgi:hypothetical protein
MPYKRSQDPPSATRGRSRRIRTKNAVHSKTCVACLCALVAGESQVSRCRTHCLIPCIIGQHCRGRAVLLR